jgi:hypothetical protein
MGDDVKVERNEEVVVGAVDSKGITDDDATVDSDDDNGAKNETIVDSVVVVVEEEVEEVNLVDEVGEKEIGVGLKVVDDDKFGGEGKGEGVGDCVKGVGVGSSVGNGVVGRGVVVVDFGVGGFGAGVGTGVNGLDVGNGVGNGVGDFVDGAVGGACVLIGILVCCMQKGLSGENGKHVHQLGASKQSRQLPSTALGFCNVLQGAGDHDFV